jgi:hypothetical protein
MAMIVLGLVNDAHAARGLVRALDDAGFSGDDIDVTSATLQQALIARGVPTEDAHAVTESVRSGGSLVCARADDEGEATEAAQVMSERGALANPRIYADARVYHGPERRMAPRPYAGLNRRAA